MSHGDGRDTVAKLVMQPVQAALDSLLGDAIKRGGGFIKQQNLWLLRECTCDRKALLLASRHLASSGTYERLQLVRQGQQEVKNSCKTRCLHGLVVRHGRLACFDVGKHGGGKKNGLLTDIADLLSPSSNGKTDEGHAVDVNFTGRRIVEALYQLNGCALSRSTLPDESNFLTFPDREAEILQNRGVRPGGISEAHGFELNELNRRYMRQLFLRLQILLILNILRFAVHHISHGFGCHRSLGHLRCETTELAETREAHNQRE
mmetsp:Transcript_164/g.365  ORF Transcript_164/g.365 Transcript_164/m.365 type:complete len:262 (+) Transcript_164:2082-2867(+)